MIIRRALDSSEDCVTITLGRSSALLGDDGGEVKEGGKGGGRLGRGSGRGRRRELQ